jgi:fructokinase
MGFLNSAGSPLKILDINLRQGFYTTEIIFYSLEKADIVKMNEDELYEIVKYLDVKSPTTIEISERIVKEWSLSHLIISLGKRGVLFFSSEEQFFYIPGFSVPQADTEGCGDAFTAGFLHQYLRESAVVMCCYWGNLLGGITASQKGATQPIFPHDIRQFQKEHHSLVVDPIFKQYIPDTIYRYLEDSIPF